MLRMWILLRVREVKKLAFAKATERTSPSGIEATRRARTIMDLCTKSVITSASLE